MIDFRYHVVSIVAVFLALTVGLVIGSSYLSKVAYDELNNQLSSLRGQNQALHGTQNELSAQVRDRDSLIAALGPDAVSGKLIGHSVAVVMLPGADGSSGDALSDLLGKAGAQVTDEVTLKSSLLDPDQGGKLAAAAAKLPAAERGGAQLPAPSSSATSATPPSVIALADIAGAVVHRIPANNSGVGEQAITDQASQDVLTAYSNAGYIDVKSASATSADLVVVMAPPAPSSGSSANDAADALYLGFLKDLTGGGRSLGAVLAGPASSAESPGLLAAALKDSWVSKNVSTADTADQASGRIITVFALAEAAGGKTGHYGLTGTADGPLPDLH
ncbi:copper transporter [Catenulispora pinisilvae]|uniref:copper transporter n=1 Tax=Catenulispora pinisilvae TaxID=2705253 RepID=UPI001891727C|nr:copper transporter [Catenulispora pinisilvae]